MKKLVLLGIIGAGFALVACQSVVGRQPTQPGPSVQAVPQSLGENILRAQSLIDGGSPIDIAKAEELASDLVHAKGSTHRTSKIAQLTEALKEVGEPSGENPVGLRSDHEVYVVQITGDVAPPVSGPGERKYSQASVVVDKATGHIVTAVVR